MWPSSERSWYPIFSDGGGYASQGVGGQGRRPWVSSGKDAVAALPCKIC